MLACCSKAAQGKTANSGVLPNSDVLLLCGDLLAEHANQTYDRMYDMLATACDHKPDKMFIFFNHKESVSEITDKWEVPAFAEDTIAKVINKRGGRCVRADNSPVVYACFVTTTCCMRELALRYRPAVPAERAGSEQK